MKKNGFVYSKPMFLLLNFIFFFVHLFIVILYGIFVLPFKSIYNLYQFMIQINIFNKIEKQLVKLFDLDLKNIPCEVSFTYAQIGAIISKFNYYETNSEIPYVKSTSSDNRFDYFYEYRGIKLHIGKQKGIYIIVLEMNGKLLINCRKAYSPYVRANKKFESLFLQ